MMCCVLCFCVFVFVFVFVFVLVFVSVLVFVCVFARVPVLARVYVFNLAFGLLGVFDGFLEFSYSFPMCSMSFNCVSMRCQIIQMINNNKCEERGPVCWAV